jgi:nicotinamide-nucleotide amidase
MNNEPNLVEQARRVATQLEHCGRQLVLAESCTAGLVAALLGGVPGISRFLCGSAVVYQEATKTAWIGVPESLLAEVGAVSHDVAATMVSGVLERTPQAHFAAAITGHLGPDAPAELDGCLYIALQFRGSVPQVRAHRLPPAKSSDQARVRRERQRAAAAFLLQEISAALDGVR